MKFKFIIPIITLLIFIDIYVYSCIAELVSQKSDIAVSIGLLCLLVFLIVNYLILNFTFKHKPTK